MIRTYAYKAIDGKLFENEIDAVKYEINLAEEKERELCYQKFKGWYYSDNEIEDMIYDSDYGSMTRTLFDWLIYNYKSIMDFNLKRFVKTKG